MKPKRQFDTNVGAADAYIKMYEELRSLKELGSRGSLDAANRYLLWLPRGAVVAALSSLDAYVHQILYVRLPKILGDSSTEVSDALAELVFRVMPVKNADSARDALAVARAPDGPKLLATRIEDKLLQYESYQAPEKLIIAYSHLGVPNLFEDVAAAWPGPGWSCARPAVVDFEVLEKLADALDVHPKDLITRARS